MMSLPPDLLLVVPPHPVLVVFELILILYPVFRRLVPVPIHPVGLRLPQQLLRSDLDLRWCVILDLCYTHGSKVLQT